MDAERFGEALEGVREVDITVTGRKTGRDITLPVWFVREADSVYLLPVTGSDSNWYRNLLRTPRIRISTDGMEYRSEVVAVTGRDEVDTVVDRFRDKYGPDNIRAYYSKRDVAVRVPLR